MVVSSSESRAGVKVMLNQFAEFGLPFQFLCGVVRAPSPPSQLARKSC